MPQVIIYCDGSCRNSTKEGGWGFVVLANGQIHGYGHADGIQTGVTSNQMELMAALKSMEYCVNQKDWSASDVTIRSDSQYVMKGLTTWYKLWVERQWRTYDGDAVANRLHWKRLMNLMGQVRERHKLEFAWTKGHVEGQNPWNHVADHLAAYRGLAGDKAELIRQVKKNGPNHVFELTKSGKPKAVRNPVITPAARTKI